MSVSTGIPAFLAFVKINYIRNSKEKVTVNTLTYTCEVREEMSNFSLSWHPQ